MPSEVVFENSFSEIIICNECRGRGKIVPWRSDMDGDVEFVECKRCKGFGRLYKRSIITHETME